jgi:DNA-binding NarL/FixJ family response regulator
MNENKTNQKKAVVISPNSFLRRGYRGMLEGMGYCVEEFPDKYESGFISEKREPEKERAGLFVFHCRVNPRGVFGFHELMKCSKKAPTLVTSIYDSFSFIHRFLSIGAKGFVDLNEKPETIKKALERTSEKQIFLNEHHNQTVLETLLSPSPNPSPQKCPICNLTNRQIDLFLLLGHGLTNPEIASSIEVTLSTVNKYFEEIRDRAGVSSKQRLRQKAIEFTQPYCIRE